MGRPREADRAALAESAVLDFQAAPIPLLLPAWRAAMGLTQPAAGALLGVPTVTWSRWEQGAATPAPDGPLRYALRAAYAARERADGAWGV